MSKHKSYITFQNNSHAEMIINNFQEKYDNLMLNTKKRIDNDNLDNYANFIESKNEIHYDFLERFTDNTQLFNDRQDEILKVAKRFNNRLLIEDNKILKINIESLKDSQEKIENSLGFLNSIHSRLKKNLIKIEEEFKKETIIIRMNNKNGSSEEIVMRKVENKNESSERNKSHKAYEFKIQL